MAALAAGGAWFYSSLKAKALQEADDSFTLVMNAIAGEANWERGELKYDLASKTLTVNRVIVRFPEIDKIDRMTLDSVMVKGAPRKAEIEKILAAKERINVPEARLLDEALLTGISIQGTPDSPLTRATAKSLAISGARLAASGAKPNPLSPAADIALGSLTLDSLDVLIEARREKFSYQLAQLVINDYYLDWSQITDLYNPVPFIRAMRLGESTFKGADMDLRVDDARFSLSMAEYSIKNAENGIIGSISYSDVKSNFYSNGEFDVDFALGEAGAAGIDFGAFTDKILEIEETNILELEELASLFTIGDLCAGFFAHDSYYLKDLSAAFGQEFSLKLDSVAVTGPFIPGKIPPKASGGFSGFTMTLNPKGTMPELSAARMMTSLIGLNSITWSADASCEYEAGSGTLACQGTPFSISGLAEEKFSFTLTGLTPDLFERISKITLADIEDALSLPQAKNLRLAKYRQELVNLGLVEKLYDIGEFFGTDREAAKTIARGYITSLLPLEANFDQIDRLQTDLLAFINGPGRIAVELSPSIPLFDLGSINARNEKDAFNAMGLSVSINGRPAIPLTMGLGAAAPKELPAASPKAQMAPPEVDSGAAEREAAAKADAQKAATIVAQQEAILALVLDKMFQPGRWTSGKTAFDAVKGTFEAADIVAELPWELAGPMTIGKISWTKAAEHEDLWRVLFANDWANQPDTPLFDNLKAENIVIPVSDEEGAYGELKVQALRVERAQMTAGGPEPAKTAMDFWAHLFTGRVDIDNLAFELVVDQAAGQIIRLDFANLGATSLALGRGQKPPQGPGQDTLNFLKGVAAEEGRLSGLDFSAVSPDGSIDLKIGAMSVTGITRLASSHKSVDEARFEIKRSGAEAGQMAFSLGRLDLSGLDPAELIKRYEPDYRSLMASGTPAPQALAAVLFNLGGYLRAFDVASPPIAFVSLDIAAARVEAGQSAVTLSRLEATGPWKPGALPANQKIEFEGNWELLDPNDPAAGDEAQLPPPAPDSLEAIMGGRAATFSGRWLGEFNNRTATFTLSLDSPSLASINSELAFTGVTPELISFLYQIPAGEHERALYVPGFDALSLTSAKITLSDPEVVSRFLNVAGSDPAARANTADRLAKTLVGLLGQGAPGQELVVADLREFLTKPDLLILAAEPKTPLPLSTMIGASDWRGIVNSLNSTVTVNRRTPLLVKAQAASD